MLRAVCVAGATVGFSALFAQTPHVSISADFNPQLNFTPEGAVRFRMYNDEAQFSRIRLGITLENGWVARIHQKIGRIDNDPDDSGTEVAFLERPGWWRVGKIYAPFGGGHVVRENGFGALADSTLLIGDMPILVSYINNGKGKQHGVVGRIGATFGLSVAYGEHFGIGSTSFTQIRPPEASLGAGRGYGLIIGADVEKSFGGLTASIEYMWLRDGSTLLDRDEELLNIRGAYQFPYGPLIEGEATYTFRDSSTNFRIGAQLSAIDKVFFVPSVRYYEKFGWRIGLGLRVRL